MTISLSSPLVFLTFQDYPDVEAHAGIIRFVGCPHKCPECHSAFLQSKLGIPMALGADDSLPGRLIEFSSYGEAVEAIDRQLKRCRTNKLVLQGGEPLLPGENLEFTKYLCGLAQYDVCIYTGYDVDHVVQSCVTGFKYLKCGLFDASKARTSGKDDNEMVLASPNQEFYDSEFRKISDNGILKFTRNN